MRRLVVGLVALALASTAGGCRREAGDGSARCDQAGARFLELARAQVAGEAARGGLDRETRHMVDGTLPAIRDALVRACTEQRWSPAARDCFATAADGAAVAACHEALPAEQREALDLARLGPAKP
jgi:hypothetical protein